MPKAPLSPAAYRWELVGLLWVAFFLNQADRQVFNVVLPLIRSDLSLSDQQLGLVATVFTVVYGLLVPFAGIAGDRFDRRKVVFLSLLVFSTGTLLTGFATSFILLLVFRGLATGAGEAFYAPAAASLIGTSHVETSGRALSVHQTANYTGIVLGSLVAGWVGQNFGWRASFLVFGIGGVLWSVIFVRRTARYAMLAKAQSAATPVSRSATFGEAIRLVAGSPRLIGQLLAFGGLVFVHVGFATWTPTLLYERFGLSLTEAGFSAVFYHYLLAAAGVLAASWIADRMIRRMPSFRLLSMAGGLMLCGPAIWAIAQADDLASTYLALAVFGFFRGIYDAGIFAGVFDIVEDRLRATVTGLLLASGFLIGAASPLIMGMLKADYGLDGGLRLLAAVAVGAGAILLVLTLVPVREAARVK